MELSSAFQWVSRLASLLLFLSFVTTRLPGGTQTMKRQSLPSQTFRRQGFPSESLKQVVHTETPGQVVPTGTLNYHAILAETLNDQVAPTETLNQVVSAENLKGQVVSSEALKRQVVSSEALKKQVVSSETLKHQIISAAETLNKQIISTGTLQETINQAKNGIKNNSTDEADSDLPCQGVKQHHGYASSCDYVKATLACSNESSSSIFNYTFFFFCTCSKLPIIGYIILTTWLLVLFYTLGNTAADYFCCSLEKLSKLLKCPPTLAGVTLLPLGNGAPDVFASIASFIGANAGQVGLNSVIGGGVFITTVVAGSVSLLVSNTGSAAAKRKKIDKRSFFRDVGFFLFTLLALTLILVAGHIYLWGALAFLSIYGLYAIAVAISEIWKRRPEKPEWSQIQLLPFTTGASLLQEEGEEEEESGENDDSLYSPLLDGPSAMPVEQTTLPQWRWASKVAIYSHKSFGEAASRPLWEWSEEQDDARSYLRVTARLFMNLLEWPLALPRRLTIPVVEEDRWSWGFALASSGLAPIFFAFVVGSQDDSSFGDNITLYIGATLVGLVFLVLAYFTTPTDAPPRRFLLPWVVGGFVMSIVWFFMVANELVALLVTFGMILDVDPSILGLTVLAWGNSMGDLMANTSLASNGGDGIQIALSGCYAGPMFNTLIGIGVSLVLGSWASRPHPFAIPPDGSLFYTLAFLVVGLLWALVILPLKKMRPSKLLGIGLLSLYFLFLSFRLAHALGVITVPWQL